MTRGAYADWFAERAPRRPRPDSWRDVFAAGYRAGAARGLVTRLVALGDDATGWRTPWVEATFRREGRGLTLAEPLTLRGLPRARFTAAVVVADAGDRVDAGTVAIAADGSREGDALTFPAGALRVDLGDEVPTPACGDEYCSACEPGNYEAELEADRRRGVDDRG